MTTQTKMVTLAAASAAAGSLLATLAPNKAVRSVFVGWRFPRGRSSPEPSP